MSTKLCDIGETLIVGLTIQPSSSAGGEQPIDVKPDVGVLDLTTFEDDSTTRVKRERGPVPPIVPGEVIDLT